MSFNFFVLFWRLAEKSLNENVLVVVTFLQNCHHIAFLLPSPATCYSFIYFFSPRIVTLRTTKSCMNFKPTQPGIDKGTLSVLLERRHFQKLFEVVGYMGNLN